MTMSFGLIASLIALIALGIVSFIGYLMYKIAARDTVIAQLQEYQQKMSRSFRELDEQAKLIVRTDLQLNRAQSELDKRLNGLNALQRATRSISQALNESEIYQRLTLNLFEELGFAKVFVASLADNNQLRGRMILGYAEDKIAPIIKSINSDEAITAAFKEKQLVSSTNATRKLKDKVISIFDTEHFILIPVTTQSDVIGFIFVGNRLNAPAITQGDEELIAILAGQLGQAIENAQLFEKVFKSSQELEIKVRERTKQLASALETVEEISHKKSAFISAVSHELRTPLTSIKGFAALLIAGKIGEVPDSVKERLIKINNHSDNLVALINDLLDIARIESGRVEMKFSNHATKNVVDNVIDLLTPQITAKEIKCSTRLSADIPSLYIDHTQAERVFINLLSNAIKFTPKGGSITISVSSSPVPGFATCQVTDTGIGIPPDEVNKLFSEFYRVDNEINQHVKGTGLGLVLAKNIVLAHKGKMWVSSQVGIGTTFAFTLPTSQDAMANVTKEHTPNA